jgi:hypothetical protein
MRTTLSLHPAHLSQCGTPASCNPAACSVPLRCVVEGNAHCIIFAPSHLSQCGTPASCTPAACSVPLRCVVEGTAYCAIPEPLSPITVWNTSFMHPSRMFRCCQCTADSYTALCCCCCCTASWPVLLLLLLGCQESGKLYLSQRYAMIAADSGKRRSPSTRNGT